MTYHAPSPPCRMRLCPLAACVACCYVAAILPGCAEYSRYEIELVPAGAALERTLICQRLPDRSDGPVFPAAELERIAGLYPQRLTPPDARRHAFRGLFLREMPADVGGAGTYARFETSLGFAAVYVERFRGELDLDAALYDRRRNVDRAVDLIVGWFEQQMGGSPHWEQVQRFLHQQFRQDLRNISTYLWLAEQQPQFTESFRKESFLRAALYLKERGYLEVEDLLTLARADRQEPVQLLAWIKGVLARKCGLSDDAAGTELAFLNDPAELQRSWNHYLRTTPEYRRLIKRWQAAPHGPADMPPEPLQVFTDLLLEPVIALLAARPDELHVTLASEASPWDTNGQWDPAQQRVVWSLKLPRGRSLPVLLYARWAQPDAKAQTRHFGRIILSGETLSEYAIWHAGLNERERQEWEAFLATLHPGDELPARIAAFRFSHEAERIPELEQQPRPLSDRVQQILSSALSATQPDP